MHANAQRLLYWSPRVLGVLFAAFLSLFALDVFTEERDALSVFAALLVHLVPVLMVVTALAISWRMDACGGPLFLGAAVFYAVGNLAHLDWVLLISGPLLLISILFVASWIWASRANSAA